MSLENKQIRFFDPGKAYQAHRDEILPEIDRVLSAGDLILRKDLGDFEQNLATFCGKKYAVGLNSGTDALYLALKVAGVGIGDEVIVSAHTFVASVQVIVQLGAYPVLVDREEDWKKYITKKTKAVIPCHISGIVLDWEPVNGIVMIDDSCQALGAAGLKGDIQCWSFYPAKILGAYGDAGGITTDNEQYASDIKNLGNHWKSDYTKWGINSRMDNVQAAILNVKMKYLLQTIKRREEIANRYGEILNDNLILPSYQKGRVWQDYIIYTKERDAFFNFLKEHGVETIKNEYPMPLKKPINASLYEKYTLRLPINEILTDEEIMYVAEQVNLYFE